jgi:hypothetical protein
MRLRDILAGKEELAAAARVGGGRLDAGVKADGVASGAPRWPLPDALCVVRGHDRPVRELNGR